MERVGDQFVTKQDFTTTGFRFTLRKYFFDNKFLGVKGLGQY